MRGLEKLFQTNSYNYRFFYFNEVWLTNKYFLALLIHA